MTAKRKFISIIIALSIFFLVSLADRLGYINLRLDVLRVQNLIEGTGLWGILIFLLITMFRQLFLMPTTVVYISAGLLFGTAFGSLYSVAGHMVNITLAYGVGRHFKDGMSRFVSEKYVTKLRGLDGKGSFRQLFAMRITPGFPVDPISFGSGFVEMNFDRYFLATFLGSTPKIILYAHLGQQAQDPLSPQTIIPLAFLLVLAFLPYLFKKWKDHL